MERSNPAEGWSLGWEGGKAVSSLKHTSEERRGCGRGSGSTARAMSIRGALGPQGPRWIWEEPSEPPLHPACTPPHGTPQLVYGVRRKTRNGGARELSQ